MRRRKPTLTTQKDDRVRISVSLTRAEADKVEAAAGADAPASWCRWAVLTMADRVMA